MSTPQKEPQQVQKTVTIEVGNNDDMNEIYSWIIWQEFDLLYLWLARRCTPLLGVDNSRISQTDILALAQETTTIEYNDSDHWHSGLLWINAVNSLLRIVYYRFMILCSSASLT